MDPEPNMPYIMIGNNAVWYTRPYTADTGEIVLPSAGETAAISLRVKTAALCYDRVWAVSNNVVPDDIRVWGGSDAELGGEGLAADWNMKTNRAPIAAMHAPDDKRLAMMAAATDQGLGWTFRQIAHSFQLEHGTSMTPIYDLAKDNETAYKEGQREVVVSTISKLAIVDEGALTWEQVKEFRNDDEAKRKYRRFLHWLDKDMVGKSQSFIEDEISERLEDYGWAIKKHGMKTVLGTIEESLDGKYLLGATVALHGDPAIGALLAGLVLAGKVFVKLRQTQLEYEDVERGPNSEIAWLYDLKKLESEES